MRRCSSCGPRRMPDGAALLAVGGYGRGVTAGDRSSAHGRKRTSVCGPRCRYRSVQSRSLFAACAGQRLRRELHVAGPGHQSGAGVGGYQEARASDRRNRAMEGRPNRPERSRYRPAIFGAHRGCSEFHEEETDGGADQSRSGDQRLVHHSRSFIRCCIRRDDPDDGQPGALRARTYTKTMFAAPI